MAVAYVRGSATYRGFKLAIVGADIALRSEAMAPEMCDAIDQRIPPSGVAHHILRAAQNRHFPPNLPSSQGAGGDVPKRQTHGQREFRHKRWRRYFVRIGCPMCYQGYPQVPVPSIWEAGVDGRASPEKVAYNHGFNERPRNGAIL